MGHFEEFGIVSMPADGEGIDFAEGESMLHFMDDGLRIVRQGGEVFLLTAFRHMKKEGTKGTEGTKVLLEN